MTGLIPRPDGSHAPGKDRSWRKRVVRRAGNETGDAALCGGAILPQLLDGTVLQDVDVTDRQPGFGRDLGSRPALDIPAVDDVRLAAAPASSMPAAPLRAWIPAPAHTRQFSLDVRGTWHDNGPVLPVAACNPHNGDSLNRHTDDALLLPALFNLDYPANSAGLCRGFRLDPPWAVIRGVSAEHRDLFTTARHM